MVFSFTFFGMEFIEVQKRTKKTFPVREKHKTKLNILLMIGTERSKLEFDVWLSSNRHIVDIS